jgi:hypothetical protein
MLAMDEINSRKDLLPNTTLVHNWDITLYADNASASNPSFIGQEAGQMVTDDQCDPKMGVNVLMQQITQNPNVGGILGPGCSSVCMATSQIATGLRVSVVVNCSVHNYNHYNLLLRAYRSHKFRFRAPTRHYLTIQSTPGLLGSLEVTA